MKIRDIKQYTNYQLLGKQEKITNQKGKNKICS